MEGLKGRSSETIFAGVCPLVVVVQKPLVNIGLKLVEGRVDLLTESDRIELLTNGFVKALGDAVGLRRVGFGLGVVDGFEGQVQFIFMVLDAAALFGASVGENAQ